MFEFEHAEGWDSLCIDRICLHFLKEIHFGLKIITKPKEKLHKYAKDFHLE